MNKETQEQNESIARGIDQLFSLRHAEYLVGRWFDEGLTISPDIKDKIGLFWISIALNLGDETSQKFSGSKNVDIINQIKRIETGKPENVQKFWESVREIVPQLVGDDGNIRFLVEMDNNHRGTFALIRNLEQASLYSKETKSSKILKRIIEIREDLF